MDWCTGNTTYDLWLTVGLGYALFAGVASLWIPAPYGRFASPRYGLSMSPRLGWFLMELPAVPVFCFFFFTGARWADPVPLLFGAVWLVHYSNRGYLFPYLLRTTPGAKTSFGLLVVMAGWGATALHGYLNASFLSTHSASTQFTLSWLTDPRFGAGVVLYYVSFGLTIHSEAIVRNLRTTEELAAEKKPYRIPRGGLFRWLTSPQYSTELTAWAGFALMTWSPGGLFIFAISCANLIPRAFATHRWYRDHFQDYPPERKALIPFVL
jgi:3-oxo-5-alpha-steroid 4-dehydrogenase 1